MIFQTTTLIFSYIKNAVTLTEIDNLELKRLALNNNCDIDKIEIQTKKELITLPKGQNTTTSKYITQLSSQFYSSLSIWRKLSVSSNELEIQKSSDSTVSFTNKSLSLNKICHIVLV